MFPLSKKPIRAVFFVGFIFAFHVALTTYINSPFLSDYTNSPGILYTLASIATITGFFAMPHLLNRFGNRVVALTLTLTIIIALFGLSVTQTALPIFLLFVAYFSSSTLLFYSLDVFLEGHSDDATTGTIRGSYLSTLNSAWLFAPIIAGAILATTNYQTIYSLGILLVTPVFFIIWSAFKKFKDPVYEHVPLLRSAGTVFADKNIRKIYATAFLLQFFYASMTIFMPIYLLDIVGFSWSTIGLIFTVMLLPFALLQRPLGYLADNKWGEKEILSAGIILIGIFTICVAFLDTTNPLIWAFMLLMTRVGAASVEVMNDSYFFKHVDQSDAGIIGFFRSATPTAYIISPLLATIALGFFTHQTVFIALGIVMFTGLFASLRIEDTR